MIRDISRKTSVLRIAWRTLTQKTMHLMEWLRMLGG